jgi:GNAT superfamily N-acetyltransferase
MTNSTGAVFHVAGHNRLDPAIGESRMALDDVLGSRRHHEGTSRGTGLSIPQVSRGRSAWLNMPNVVAQPRPERDDVPMSLAVREMALDEVDLIIDYFNGATPEHLETVGVDPTRLPKRRDWQAGYVAEYRKPAKERSTLLVIWELDGVAVGFSTADKVVYGEQAHMHLHVVDPNRRGSGIGSACVRETAMLYFAMLYFDALALKLLFCDRAHSLCDLRRAGHEVPPARCGARVRQ